jgi:NADPH:quinone reductase-like Zn-dependent oxidoreductase
MQMVPHPTRAPRAATVTAFGGPDGLACRTMSRMPVPGAGEVLVAIAASSVNAIDWKIRRGIGAPKWLWRRLLGPERVPGIDFAGRIVAVGPGGDQARIGTAVMGIRPYAGTHADVAVMRLDRVVMVDKPTSISFAEAGVIPFAALTAVKALRTRPIRGGRVLIVGASGGVGHLAVQMAKHCLGAALVVGVGKAADRPMMLGCGADVVLTREELPSPVALLTHRPDWLGTFDLIVDAAGVDGWWTDVAPRLLHASGGFAAVALPQQGGRSGEDVGIIGALRLGAALAWRRVGGRYAFVGGLLGALDDPGALALIAKWLDEGQLRPRIAARFPLHRIADAHRMLEAGGAAGKIALLMQSSTVTRRADRNTTPVSEREDT